jgi:hypothetical protein
MIWATVRRLLPLAIAANVGFLVFWRLAPANAPLLYFIGHAVLAVVAGWSAHYRGGGWGAAIWAAWLLNTLAALVVAIPANLVGWGPALPTSAVPARPATWVNLADPTIIQAFAVAIPIAILIVVLLTLIADAPFALLGYWVSNEEADR